ncbi:hypothetical protein COCNU_06G007960 [Cocos nucifera]|uniref:Uncharacterized protein n=1 Tax=Cocos nucifera TaxID=13894 RepID=A0A8K0IBY6_COCNU|nr:hypothetical protein COCNU_06G007960 [Cocos nucifera]
MSKSKVSFILDEMRKETPITALMCSYSPLETEGEPCPNMSKIEDLRLFKTGGGVRPIQWPVCAPITMLGIEGEPRPNMSKLKASFILDEMRKDVLIMALMYPYSPLGTGREPHPNVSKVEDLRLFKKEREERPIQWPICAPIVILGIGEKSHPNMSKSKVSFILYEMRGEALTTTLKCPYSPLGAGGESHSNMSKVEDIRLFKTEGRKSLAGAEMDEKVDVSFPDNDYHVDEKAVMTRGNTESSSPRTTATCSVHTSIVIGHEKRAVVTGLLHFTEMHLLGMEKLYMLTCMDITITVHESIFLDIENAAAANITAVSSYFEAILHGFTADLISGFNIATALHGFVAALLGLAANTTFTTPTGVAAPTGIDAAHGSNHAAGMVGSHFQHVSSKIKEKGKMKVKGDCCG